MLNFKMRTGQNSLTFQVIDDRFDFRGYFKWFFWNWNSKILTLKRWWITSYLHVGDRKGVFDITRMAFNSYRTRPTCFFLPVTSRSNNVQCRKRKAFFFYSIEVKRIYCSLHWNTLRDCRALHSLHVVKQWPWTETSGAEHEAAGVLFCPHVLSSHACRSLRLKVWQPSSRSWKTLPRNSTICVEAERRTGTSLTPCSSPLHQMPGFHG